MNSNFPSHAAPIKLYRHPKSGHSHRVELMMALLGLPYETVDIDLKNGAHKAPAFLAISPFGQVPVIDDNGVMLSDSNAILVYLVKSYPTGHDWLPESPAGAAEVQRWLSVAAGEIARGPCAARLVTVFGASLDHDGAKAAAHRLLAQLEPILERRDFLAGPAITIADVAGYSYIAHAPEGGVSLDAYPAIRSWLTRVEAQEGFVGMVRTPLPETA
ncbi:glutathione S-transferase [Halomonas sp. MCCC 1A17488]|uniref:Glutathione S-transferase n=1 Tax=Billgrantia sulfidoxydans TaxID=2733484 RepID=A0ABX7W8D3_9GAMM|nr:MULTISPECIES: glutathione S-transferase [Halomonas]MCE8018398.1 glutathione S-transferase [Halomonas sp. MCCC 1A17488]MCG3241731.1 glutathione S-transferase [Halomonas sp. MCCC 1A17488]QPP49242.1 glutathione S-transferase [Halomonas sp. SS10-MC5]QTP56601.1 glutathione S-transferase [Halomonas sulfidoxydans]